MELYRLFRILWNCYDHKGVHKSGFNTVQATWMKESVCAPVCSQKLVVNHFNETYFLLLSLFYKKVAKVVLPLGRGRIPTGIKGADAVEYLVHTVSLRKNGFATSANFGVQKAPRMTQQHEKSWFRRTIFLHAWNLASTILVISGSTGMFRPTNLITDQFQ